MNNLSSYNDFKNTKRVNEAQTSGPKPFQTTHGAGSYGGSIGDRDTYFANVHGNLAGAENTLVGGALIRMFGFLKRKGMEVYIKMRLKPELGRIYMNGILRYAVKQGLVGPRKKEFFVVKKYENEEEVEFKNKVSFTYNGISGSSSIIVGATVKTETTEPVLVDGKYICVANNVIFVVKNNVISEVLNGEDKKTTETKESEDKTQEETDEEVQVVQPSEEELKIERDEYEKKLIEGAGDIEPTDDVKNDIIFLEKTLSDIDNNTKASNNVLSEENKNFLNEWNKALKKDIKLLKDEGVNFIDQILSKDTESKLGLERERQEYLANIKALIGISDKITMFLNKHTQEKTDEEIKEAIIKFYNDFLLEKTAPVNVKDVNVGKTSKTSDINVKSNKPVVNRLGDELQELAKTGETIDLNDENFYRQFENNEVKKAVSNEILTDRPGLIKLQLTAEKIINGGVVVYDREGNKLPSNNLKLENYWKRTVQDVLSMYSKFMDTGMVDPLVISQQLSSSDKDDYNKPGKNSELDKLNNSMSSQKNLSNKKFKNSVEVVKNISKSDYGIMRLKFSDEEDGELGTPYIVRRITSDTDVLKVYRVLRKFDLDKVSPEFLEKDFTSLVYNQFTKKLLPKIDDDFNSKFIDGQFRGLKGIYIISNRQKNFSVGSAQNHISILYLFSKLDELSDQDWDNYSQEGNWMFKLKNFKTGNAENLDEHFKSLNTEDLKKQYKTPLMINEIIYKITQIDLFGKFKHFEILKGRKQLDDFYSKYFKQE